MSIIETMIDIPMEHERNVCGQFDAYLKKIERTLHVTMITRDGALKIIGPEQTIRQAKEKEAAKVAEEMKKAEREDVPAGNEQEPKDGKRSGEAASGNRKEAGE